MQHFVDYLDRTGPIVGLRTATHGFLPTPHVGASWALLADGSVLVTDGMTWDGESAGRERYDPASGAWHPIDQPIRRGSHSATLLPSGEVLIAGGAALDITCELYNPSTETWTPTGPLPAIRTQHTATLLPNGKVLVAGGNVLSTEHLNESPAANTCLLYDPAIGTWSPARDFRHPRSQHTATLLDNGSVLLVGGYDERGSPTKSAEVDDVGKDSTSDSVKGLVAKR